MREDVHVRDDRLCLWKGLGKYKCESGTSIDYE